VSTQSSAVANRSGIPASWVTISGELLDHAPAPQFGGVAHDRLEPQHAFAFGAGLAGQPLEVQLEHGQVRHYSMQSAITGSTSTGRHSATTPPWCGVA
jgi:hypothetical protein